VAERSHLSIGEVLSLLREEFPDVTISKIRFLESQGLVDPERTPSGYRKFYDHDVDRLRWILRQQREHFLPLKVIRGRLTDSEGGEGVEAEEDPFEAAAPAERSGRAASAEDRARKPAAVLTEAPPSGERGGEGAGRGNGPSRQAPPTPSLFAGLHSDTPSPPASSGRSGPFEPAGAAPGSNAPAAESPAAESPAAEAPASAARAAHGGSTGTGRGAAAPSGASRPAGRESAEPTDGPDNYSADELAAAAGTEVALVNELKQYGLIAPHGVVAGVPYFDHSALAVTRTAVEFSRHGVEARHLRMWRNAADREADLFQQVVLPMLRQRNPQARRQAVDTLAELSAAGAAMRAALVERAIRDIR
jgi:DNA-binding transcriptional MerR regulator